MKKKPLTKIVIWILPLGIVGLLLVIVEGASSILLAVNNVRDGPEATEVSEYDRDLGWTGSRNAYSPDHYGSGKYVRTNSRGFRNAAEFPDEIPDGKLRIVCSGDSFTYGQGVSNDNSWCNLLSILDPRIEVVNLGLPGYGIDQMYLRYREEASTLAHDIHIFAFISGDLIRMSRNNQHGFGKPKLRLIGGHLEAVGQPVPKLKWDLNRAIASADLRMVDLGQRVIQRLVRPTPYDPRADIKLKELVTSVLQEIRTLGEERSILPLFVYLPTTGILKSDTHWENWLNDSDTDLGVELIDLTPGMRAISAQQAASFFIPEHKTARGHYTEQGNMWVAEQLYAWLQSIDVVRQRLESLNDQ